MEGVGKLFFGILLATLGVFVVYQSFYHHLIEIFVLFGVILFIIGIYFLVLVFLDNSADKKPKRIKSIDSVPNYKIFSNGVFNKNSKINKKESKKIIDKVKNVPKSKKQKNEVLKKPSSKAKNTDKKLTFTPNYERPAKVNRKPLKKSDLVDVSNAPDISKIPKVSKSKEIFEALASDDFIETEHNLENNNTPKSQESPKSKSSISNSDKNDHNNKEFNKNDEINEVNNKNDEINEVNNVAEKSENTIPFTDLKSLVLTSDGVKSSKQAFEQLIDNAKTEILLETSSLNDISENFSSKVPGLNVRILIQEFDIENVSIMVLVNSLIEQGAYIRVLPVVNTTNLIVDEKNALIISENEIEEELEVGAIYDEIKDILEIKDTFEKSWELATDIDNISLKLDN